MPESETGFNPRQEKTDFTNEDLRRKILESGSDDELEELKDFYAEHGIDSEKVDLFRYYARLRRNTLDSMAEEIKMRREKNPLATDEELAMGAYIEQIEPQVRNAVLASRRKGYDTYISGFFGENSQGLGFQGEPLKGFRFPEKVVSKITELGIDFKSDAGSISLHLNKELTLEQIREVWDLVEESIPDLGEQASPAKLNSAAIFRRKQQKLKNSSPDKKL